MFSLKSCSTFIKMSLIYAFFFFLFILTFLLASVYSSSFALILLFRYTFLYRFLYRVISIYFSSNQSFLVFFSLSPLILPFSRCRPLSAVRRPRLNSQSSLYPSELIVSFLVLIGTAPLVTVSPFTADFWHLGLLVLFFAHYLAPESWIY